MSQFWERVYASVIAPIDSLVSPQSAFNGIFLLLTVLFCVGVYMLRAGRVLRLRSLRRLLFPRRVFLHPSAKLDYKYYVLAAIMRVGILGSMVVSSAAVAGLVLFALEKLLGAGDARGSTALCGFADRNGHPGGDVRSRLLDFASPDA